MSSPHPGRVDAEEESLGPGHATLQCVQVVRIKEREEGEWEGETTEEKRRARREWCLEAKERKCFKKEREIESDAANRASKKMESRPLVSATWGY